MKKWIFWEIITVMKPSIQYAESPKIEFKASDAFTSNDYDNVILDQALQKKAMGKFDKFDVVAPMTTGDTNPARTEERKNYVKREFQRNGYDFDTIVDKFFEKNKLPSVLTLPSAPEKGYVVDYDGKYLSQNGGWKEGKPIEAGCLVRVSRPVCEGNIVLLEINTIWGPLVGQGLLTAFEYKDGKLKKICEVLLWIS
jgi:hypothetical protein